MKTSTQARKVADIFSDERTLPTDLADGVNLLISDTGYYRFMYFAMWLHYQRTGAAGDLPEFMELLADGERLY